MKPVAYCVLLIFCILASGCVRRTVTVSKPIRGTDGTAQQSGRNPHSKTVEEKTVWIWQKEFRNPGK